MPTLERSVSLFMRDLIHKSLIEVLGTSEPKASWLLLAHYVEASIVLFGMKTALFFQKLKGKSDEERLFWSITFRSKE